MPIGRARPKPTMLDEDGKENHKNAPNLNQSTNFIMDTSSHKLVDVAGSNYKTSGLGVSSKPFKDQLRQMASHYESGAYQALKNSARISADQSNVSDANIVPSDEESERKPNNYSEFYKTESNMQNLKAAYK
jgi:hypothetical protein